MTREVTRRCYRMTSLLSSQTRHFPNLQMLHQLRDMKARVWICTRGH